MTIQTQKDTVREFCSAWEQLDTNKIMSFMSEDAVYHNMPIAPLKRSTGNSWLYWWLFLN